MEIAHDLSTPKSHNARETEHDDPVHVGPDGSGTAVKISSTSGYALLDQAARGAVGRWHFIPARDGGKPVPSTMLLKIRFVLTNPDGDE